MSLARFNLSKESEDAINRQILVELSASYSYLSMSAWLGRDTIALSGLSEYLRKQSLEVGIHSAPTHTHQNFVIGIRACSEIHQILDHAWWQGGIADH